MVWRPHDGDNDESEEEGLEQEEWMPEGREGGVSREAIKKQVFVELLYAVR